VDEVEFDKFADEYRAMHAANIRLSGEDPEYFAEYKIVDIAAELARAAIVPRRVLDFGAGVGYSVPFFARHLPAARLTCLDVSRKSLDVGVAQHGGAADFEHFDGREIPFEDGTFDAALASCVFHHIPHVEHVALLGEIRRVLRPGGSLLFAEHGLASDPRIARWQHRLNPLWRRFSGGCNMDRAVPQMIKGAGFRLEKCETAYLRGPKVLTYNYWGAAIPA